MGFLPYQLVSQISSINSTCISFRHLKIWRMHVPLWFSPLNTLDNFTKMCRGKPLENLSTWKRWNDLSNLPDQPTFSASTSSRHLGWKEYHHLDDGISGYPFVAQLQWGDPPIFSATIWNRGEKIRLQLSVANEAICSKTKIHLGSKQTTQRNW